MKHPNWYSVTAAVLAVACVCVAVGVSQASTTNGTLSVSATIGSSCTVGAASLAFGSIDPSTSSNVVGSISVSCMAGAAYTVDLNGGLNLNSGIRRMSSGGPTPSYVPYSLYQDAARTIQWGTAVSGTTENGTGNGAAQSLPVYGQVPAQPVGQQAGPGSYTDSVTVTVSF